MVDKYKNTQILFATMVLLSAFSGCSKPDSANIGTSTKSNEKVEVAKSADNGTSTKSNEIKIESKVAQSDAEIFYKKAEKIENRDFLHPDITDEAMKLYYKSAELGYSEAQFKIGKIFENKKMSDNIEVEIENYNEAIRWYQKASEQGHLGAKEKIVGAKEALKSMTKLAELNKLVKVLDMNPLEKVLILDQSTGDQFDRFEDNGGLKFASEWRGYFVTKLKTQYRKGKLKFITMTLETVRGSNKLTSVNNIKNDLKAECGSDWSRLGEDSLGQYIAESPSVKCDMTRHKDGNISIGLFSKIE